MTLFDKTLITAIKKGRNLLVTDFDVNYVIIKHQDGSKFKITHAKIEKTKVNQLDCIIVYPEHNSVCLFVEADLVSVKVKPWKGRKYKLKIKTD